MENYINKSIKNGKLIISDSVPHDETDDKNYEFLMITGNEIPVFLSCSKLILDDKEQYIYDVNSMICLRELASKKSLTSDELIILVESICSCQDMIKSYLLSPEGLILDPDFVFFERNRRTFKYAFFPWDNEDTYSSYTKMAEFLLAAIDYSDEQAVDMGYDIYASILNKDYDLSRFIKRESDKAVTESIKEAVNSNDIKDKYALGEADEKTADEVKGGTNSKRKRLNTFSVVCLSVNSLILIFMLTVLLWSRRLFFYIFSDMKTVSVAVLIISVLLYFPVMDIVRKS